MSAPADAPTIPLTEADVKVSKAIQHIAASLDALLETYVGERYGFALYVFPFDRLGHGSYISNASRPQMQEAIQKLLERWKSGLPTPPAYARKELS